LLIKRHTIAQGRDLKKGQKAMLLAMLFPEAEKGGRGKKGKASETNGYSQVRLAVNNSMKRCFALPPGD
jgi:hypothetical protein